MANQPRTRNRYGLGSNRPNPPFEFGAPEPDLTEGSYEGLFEPQNDIQSLRTPNVLESRPTAPLPPPPDPYARETEATERFKQLISEHPERGNPGFADKLVGAAAFLGNKQRGIPGGQEAADRAKYAGYYRDVADWKSKIEPAQVAATQENTRNVNTRNLEAIASRERQTDAKIASTEKIAAEKIRVSEEKNKLVSDMNRYKRLGWTIRQAGSRIIAVNVEGERRDLGDSGMMDQIDLEELRNEGRIEAARVTGENAAGRQEAGGWDYYEDAQGNVWRKNTVTGEEEKTDGTGPQRKIGTSVPSGSQPNQLEQDRVRNEKMKGMYELGRKYITTRDRGRTFTLAPRPKITDNWFSADITQEDIDEWDKTKKELDPSYRPPSQPATPTNKPAPTQPLQQKAAEFLKANGQEATPANIAHAIKQGWVK